MVHLEPEEGKIDAFSQIEITCTCKSIAKYEHQVWTHNYSLIKEYKIPISEIYNFSTIFEIKEISNFILVLHMIG